jgi:hypothetical protein
MIQGDGSHKQHKQNNLLNYDNGYQKLHTVVLVIPSTILTWHPWISSTKYHSWT